MAALTWHLTPRVPLARPAGHGVGLTNTRARLASLYGSAASFDLVAGDGRGAIARLRLPWTDGGAPSGDVAGQA